MKTSELTGAQLDWAVGTAMKLPPPYWADGKCASFSTDWAQGGPIIEREGICLADVAGRYWVAGLTHEDKEYDGFIRAEEQGPTPLIAAMRCYVASKTGDDVELPEELK
jgi:hypothetical protein